MVAALHTRRRQRTGPRVWWIPTLAFFSLSFASLGFLSLEQLLGALIAVYLLLLFRARPALSLRLLVVILPFQLALTSWLYSLGLGGPIVRMAGLWKELAAIGVIAAGWSSARRMARRIDALDAWALAYVALGTVYMVVPELVVASFGSDLSLDVRFVAWRAMVLPVLLFVGARHVWLRHDQVARLFTIVARTGIVLGGVVLLEFTASALWNQLMIDTLQVNVFRVEVLEVDPTELGGTIDDIRTYGLVAGRSIVRVGGPMASYLQLSFVVLIALAVLLERIVQGSRTPSAIMGTGLLGAALLFTQTRSAIVGGLLLLISALRPAPGRAAGSRAKFMIFAGLVALVVVPLVFSAGLADRFTSGDVQSDDVHDIRFDAAVDSIQDNPLGTGLATGATGGQGVEGAIIPENQVLDVGVQLGVAGMVLAVVVVALVVHRLRRAAERQPSRSLELLAARGALIALLVPCWYLQPYSTPEVSWIVLAIAGAALGAADRERSAADPRVARLLGGR